MDKREVVLIRKTVPAGQSVEIRERIKSDGTLEAMKIRFYAGEGLTLQVRPVVEKRGGQAVDVVTYPAGTDNFIIGDDDYLEYTPVIAVSNDEELVVYATNTGGVDSKLVIDFEVDYYAGKKRIVGGVL